MDLADQPLLGQRLDVAADRHVRDAEHVDQLGDARPTVAVDLVGSAPDADGQARTAPRRQSRQQIAALDPTHSNTMHRLGHALVADGRSGGSHGGSAATVHARRPRPARGGATRDATSVADLTQWRACPRTTTPHPPPSRASSPACSRPHDSLHLGNYLGALRQWVDAAGRPRRVLLRRRPARDHRRARPGRCCASAPAARPRSTSPSASTPSGRTLFVQSHVPEHAAAGAGCSRASPASARPAG